MSANDRPATTGLLRQTQRQPEINYIKAD